MAFIGSLLAQINPCPLGSIVPCATGGAAGFTSYVGYVLLPEVRVAVAGIMLLFFLYYALRLILESGEDSTVTEIKSAYGQAVTGAVFVTVAGLFAAGLGNQASTTLINSDPGGPIWTVFMLVINYGKWLMGTLIMTFVMVQGIRLVVLSNQESELEKQRQKFFHAIAGVAVVLLASSIVEAVTGNNAGILGTQARGIANILLEVFGFLAVLSFIVAGLMLVFSVKEDLKDRAKKAMFGAVITLVIVFCSYMIVTFVLSV